MALRTTELTALAVPKGETIAQTGNNISQRVAYQTVREAVLVQLDSAAHEPDLPELFDFLISAGVGQNTYVGDLPDFAACCAGSNKIQLRVSAFAVANKISEEAPLTKMAVTKRAYRKKPTLGFCPNPEQAWLHVSLSHLENL